MKKILMLFVLAVVLVEVKAQNNNTSVPDTLIADKILDEEINGNLDSLLNLWYVQQSVDSNSLVIGIESDSIGLADYPDSFYIKRLQGINSLIDLPYNHIVKNFINVILSVKRIRLR